MYNILICDDEADIVEAIKIYLSSGQYNLFTAANGVEAVAIAEREDLHLIIMDIMMPVMDGILAMQRIRESQNTPIILLTAKSEDLDKIQGLHQGADDYITKPFNPVELQARVKSQLRRYLELGSGQLKQQQIKIGGLLLDDAEKSVHVDGRRVRLTPIEYELLYFLMKNPNKVYAPQTIYRKIWQEENLGSENTVAVHIRHIREKIEINPSDPRYIQVIWGQGYKLNKPKDNASKKKGEIRNVQDQR